MALWVDQAMLACPFVVWFDEHSVVCIRCACLPLFLCQFGEHGVVSRSGVLVPVGNVVWEQGRGMGLQNFDSTAGAHQFQD